MVNLEIEDWIVPRELPCLVERVTEVSLRAYQALQSLGQGGGE